MTGDRVLLTHWTDRDYLAVLIVALTVAFLTATTVLVTGTTGAATDLAADRRATTVLTTTEPTNIDAVDLRITHATRPTGDPVTVIGGPPNPLPLLHRFPQREFPAFPLTGLTTQTHAPNKLTLTGKRTTLTLPVNTRDAGKILPGSWLHSNFSVPATLGGATEYWLTNTTQTVPQSGVPERSVYAFFVAATTQLQAILLTIAAGATILVAVAVYSVARMTVRDRRDTIQLYRATGGTGRRIAVLFTGRAALVTGTGIAAGYAVGVIVPNAAINTAVFLGHPVTLSAHITAEISHQLVVMYALILGGALIAGYLAVRPITTTPPTTTLRTLSETARWERLEVIDARAVIPIVATLATFVAFVLVLLAVAGILTPVLGGGTATITEPGATHPFASTIPQGYAEALQAEGIAASPELLLFTVRDGAPFLTRGVDYDAYTTVTDSTLEAGHAPRNRSDAIIGADLATTLDLGVGDTIALGGSTVPAFTRVTIVGTYNAPGLQDDQLLVSLPTAQHLTGKPRGTVHFIRTTDLQPGASPAAPTVVSVTIPDTGVAGTQPYATVTILNPTTGEATTTVTITTPNQTIDQTVSIPAFGHRTVILSIPVTAVGEHAVTIAGNSQTITLHPPESLVLTLPATAPPGSAPLLQVETMAGDPVANATVQVGNHTGTTGPDGETRLPLDTTGTHTVSVTARDRTATTTINVTPAANRMLQATVSISPTNPGILQPVQTRVTVSNPWNETITQSITIAGPTTRTETVSLAPRERTELRATHGRLAPGTYTVTIRSDDTVLTTHDITVQGNDRLASALATAGIAAPGSGLGQATTALVGNVQVIVAILLILGAFMAVGTTTAALLQSVQAHRQSIGVYRATGIPPHKLGTMLLRDVLWVGVPATVLALLLAHAGLWLLQTVGVLTVMGVRLHAGLTPVSAGIAVIATTTVLGTAVGLTWGLILWRTPRTQLRDMREATDE